MTTEIQGWEIQYSNTFHIFRGTNVTTSQAKADCRIHRYFSHTDGIVKSFKIQDCVNKNFLKCVSFSRKFSKQESPPAGNRKRHTARSITCPSVIHSQGYPHQVPMGNTPSSPYGEGGILPVLDGVSPIGKDGGTPVRKDGVPLIRKGTGPSPTPHRGLGPGLGTPVPCGQRHTDTC